MDNTQTPEAIPATQENQMRVRAKNKHPFSGSTDADFTNTLGNQVFNSLWLAYSDKSVQEVQIQAATAAMKGMQPQDEIEGMLIGQMIASHNAAMECFRRAMIKEQSFEGRGQNLNNANKLTRSYAALLDSLTRYRSKGISEQKVTVQHVHVNEGGQAIVGNVER